mgnify:FL=1|jgi:hypothetical protein
MKLAETATAGTELRRAVHDCSNGLFDLSIEAGALAGLLKLISGSLEQLGERQAWGIGALADKAGEIENRIAELAALLDQADKATA